VFVNLLGKNRNTVKTLTVLDASKEICLEGNTDKAKYMFMSRLQSRGQHHNIKITHKSFENVTKFKYLGMTLTYQNYTIEEIRTY
jgi:hypothetical protein